LNKRENHFSVREFSAAIELGHPLDIDVGEHALIVCGVEAPLETDAGEGKRGIGLNLLDLFPVNIAMIALSLGVGHDKRIMKRFL
jgi:hypothetical protein